MSAAEALAELVVECLFDSVCRWVRQSVYRSVFVLVSYYRKSTSIVGRDGISSESTYRLGIFKGERKKSAFAFCAELAGSVTSRLVLSRLVSTQFGAARPSFGSARLGAVLARELMSVAVLKLEPEFSGLTRASFAKRDAPMAGLPELPMSKTD